MAHRPADLAHLLIPVGVPLDPVALLPGRLVPGRHGEELVDQGGVEGDLLELVVKPGHCASPPRFSR